MIPRMEEWPAWQRWGLWLFGWVLYGGAFVLVFAVSGIVPRIAAMLCVCAAMVVLTYTSRAVLNERMRKIDRWQLNVVLPAMLAYMVLMVYVFPREAHIAAPWLKVLVALLPMLPLLLVAWAMVRYVNRCDEFERRQHLEAAALAGVVVGVATLALGFLAASGLLRLNAALVLLLVFPALCLVYGLLCAWSKWRNRAR